MFLDDVREPWKNGFIGAEWAKTYDEAIALLESGKVTFASLDHDIGACADCIAKLKHIGDMLTPETTFYNRCDHAKTGYDVVCWMEEHNVWPPEGVRVHSMNPVGKQRMQVVIDMHYRGRR
jgi:hypothetical protein